MKNSIFSTACFLVFSLPLVLQAQINFHESYFLDVELGIDTSKFSWNTNTVIKNEQESLSFEYDEEEEVAEVKLYFDAEAPIESLTLIPSGDFILIDSLLLFEDYARFKVRFNGLTTSNFLRFLFKVSLTDGEEEIVELPLFPYTETYVKLYPPGNELYIGEETVFELTTNNVDNVTIDNRWSEGKPINHRITRSGANLLLHLLPNELGQHKISIQFTLHQPGIRDGKVKYQTEPMEYSFVIKSGRLAFLQFDLSEITPKDDKTESIEIQLDNHRTLQIGKTYRIENQEEPGGPLIAEIFTKAALNNGRVLCLLRIYAYHRKSNGYLYIKDGDNARFVTNIDITPKTTIEKIFIQREGKDWKESNVVYPGEKVNIRLEGEGLQKAVFSFPGTYNLEFDSLLKNEKLSIFEMNIPLTINSNKVEIFNQNQSTGKNLIIREFQRPRDFDFINLDLGDQQYTLSEISKPIYYDRTLTDLVFDFRPELIDKKDLFGSQYLTIKVKISNKKGNLIELYQFEEVVVCPDESSPRFVHYDSKSCRSDDINLNNFITKKTSELEEWSRIDLEISHQRDKYGGEGKTKKVQIILKRDYNFDIDVSFPAGLLILKSGSDDFANFGGPSFAMIAQMSFYQPGRIGKYRPYKIGAGFIAIDAFNLNENNNSRDVGLVVIGSLYPTSSENKLSFPLYAGFGYLLSEKEPFFLIGPGIRVRL